MISDIYPRYKFKMLYLILAIISSSLVSITMQVGEKYSKNNISMLSVNYFICMVLAIVYTGVENLLQTGEGMGTSIGMGFINGVFYIASLILFQNSIKQNGVVFSAIFMKLGIMVPLVISILLFKEMPTLMQVIGLVIAIAAIVLINLKEKSTDNTLGRTNKGSTPKLSLILVLIGCGLADGMSKVYQELGTDSGSSNLSDI